MAAIAPHDPPSSSEKMFRVLKQASRAVGPRLGSIAIPGRKSIETPHYLGLTSRGVIPHLSPDTFARESNISAVYVGLEDFIERTPQAIPPICKFKPADGSSPLRRFVALPDETLVVLGARRAAPVIAPAANPNTNTTISVCTSVGFRLLKAEDYVRTAEQLRPDIVVALGDVPYGRALGARRIEKGTDRSIEWVREHVAHSQNNEHGDHKPLLFPSLLPVSCANQQFYIDFLAQDVADHISGLAVFDQSSLQDLPLSLHHLSRLAFTELSTPQEVLRTVEAGLDILTVPFVGNATDAGIALDFSFPSSPEQPEDSTQPHPLGTNMWLPDHATDLAPLSHTCKCYACTNHHRAYIQHLLVAKEMLGWVLLQLHNHHVMNAFFANIRQSISAGTFEGDVISFEHAYESKLPEGTGEGPRVRGYQFKAEGPGEPKRNKQVFNTLDDVKEKVKEGIVPSANTDASELEELGFAETKKSCASACRSVAR